MARREMVVNLGIADNGSPHSINSIDLAAMEKVTKKILFRQPVSSYILSLLEMKSVLPSRRYDQNGG